MTEQYIITEAQLVRARHAIQSRSDSDFPEIVAMLQSLPELDGEQVAFYLVDPEDNRKYFYEAEEIHDSVKSKLCPLYTSPQPLPTEEPVAWVIRVGDAPHWSYCETESDADFYGKQSAMRYEKKPLYTHARPPQPLANETLEELLGQYWDAAYKEGKTGIPQSTAANAILHKLRQLLLQPKEAT